MYNFAYGENAAALNTTRASCASIILYVGLSCDAAYLHAHE